MKDAAGMFTPFAFWAAAFITLVSVFAIMAISPLKEGENPAERKVA
jgi:hypothetical protein